MNQTKITPKDFFLHLGVTIVLYTAVYSLLNLSFSIINYSFPDALASYFYVGSIAWPISMLVVLIPVLYILEWVIRRDIIKIPEKADLWIRRWRIYLTLFLTGAIIIGDLISLINTYINGEISERFVYKVIVVFIVSSVVFVYYLLQKIVESGKARTWRIILAWVGIIIVLTTIIGGFVIVGTPGKQRAIRFDKQRVNDLSNIQGQVVRYWQLKGQLPPDLDSLKDSISGNRIPTDPENKSSYNYVVEGDKKFQICAVFSLKTQDNKSRGEYYGGSSSYYATDAYYQYPGGSDEVWTHEKGRVCFSRTIDPERYPPKSIER